MQSMLSTFVNCFIEKDQGLIKNEEYSLNLRNLTRQQEGIAEISAKTKLQLHSLLDQVFPEYRGVFGSLYSKVLLLLYAHIKLQKPY